VSGIGDERHRVAEKPEDALDDHEAKVERGRKRKGDAEPIPKGVPMMVVFMMRIAIVAMVMVVMMMLVRSMGVRCFRHAPYSAPRLVQNRAGKIKVRGPSALPRRERRGKED
jgi:hypothetical protein